MKKRNQKPLRMKKAATPKLRTRTPRLPKTSRLPKQDAPTATVALPSVWPVKNTSTTSTAPATTYVESASGDPIRPPTPQTPRVSIATGTNKWV